MAAYFTDEMRERLRLVRRRHHTALRALLEECTDSDQRKQLGVLVETTAALDEMAGRVCEISDAVLGCDRALKNALEDDEPEKSGQA